MRRVFLWALCLAWVLPPAAPAAPTARQEYAAAVRSQPSLERGAERFRDCAVCHGASGSGTDDGGVPRIAGQHFKVLVRQLVDYRHNTRWDIRMEHFAGRHVLGDAGAIADVAAYASQLSAEGPRNVGDGALADHGARLYALRCAKCHGAVAEGDDAKVIPRVAGQHYEYLLRQMYDAVDGRRPNLSRDHVRLIARLERDDLVGVADFLSRLNWRNPVEQGAPPR